MAAMKFTKCTATVAALLINSGVPAAPPGDRSALVQAWPQLHTPDQITPAVLPYLACLYAERNLPPLRGSDGVPIAYDKSRGDCTAVRAAAAADAARLLAGHPAPRGMSAGALIERTLTDIDAYVAALPILGSSGADRSAVVGVPLMIEDEVQPAYARYDECLKTQVSESQVTADTIVTKFNEAMTTCRSVRDDAVVQATKALATKGWDEERRRRAAENTFAKVDEAWLAIGRQYQILLFEKASEPAAETPPR